MTEAAQLTFPLRLTIGELAFLLSLTGVQQIVGLEQAVLFPPDQAERDRLLLAGRDSLTARGVLRHDPETSSTNLDLATTALITAVAAPDAVITTTLRGGGLATQHVVHDIAGLPVEIVFDGEAFLLAGLASVDTMLARLANTLALPAARAFAGEITLAADEVKATAADPAALIARGVPAQSARELARALSAGGRQAAIRISRLRYGQATDTTHLRVLALESGAPWLAVELAGRRVAFSQADQAGFATAIAAALNGGEEAVHA